MDRADKARDELVKTMSANNRRDAAGRFRPTDQDPDVEDFASAARSGARPSSWSCAFPIRICSDHGRAISNAKQGWPETLTGRPRQAFDFFWRDHLQPNHYKLKAQIIHWPGGRRGHVRLLPAAGPSGDPERRPMDKDVEKPLKRKKYERELKELHVELVKLQEWVEARRRQGLRPLRRTRRRRQRRRRSRRSPSGSARASFASSPCRRRPSARSRRCTSSATCRICRRPARS